MGSEARPVEIRAGKTPQHHAVISRREAAKDAGGKGGGERAILLVTAHS